MSQYQAELIHSLQEFASFTQQQHTSTLEQRLLVKAINQILNPNTASSQTTATQTPFTGTADERARRITALQPQDALKRDDVKELLTACIDTRQTTKETWQELRGESWSSPDSVGRLAWEQLSQQWKMDSDARTVVIQMLDDSNAIICAAAALLLQQSKQFAENERKVAAQKIMTILCDEDLARRPLDPPDNSGKIRRLDDVLFETLRALAE